MTQRHWSSYTRIRTTTHAFVHACAYIHTYTYIHTYIHTYVFYDCVVLATRVCLLVLHAYPSSNVVGRRRCGGSGWFGDGDQICT